MEPSDRALYYGDFESDGEDAVRTNLALKRYREGQKTDLAREWLAQKQQERIDAQRAADMDLVARATAAAESAANSAKEANRIAADAKTISDRAVWIAVVGAGIAAIALILGIAT